MKKYLFATVLLLTFGITSAQNVKFGLKAGVNSSKFAIKYGTSNDVVHPTNESRTSFHVGGVVEFKINDKFSFQPELVYESIGGKSTIAQSFSGFALSQKAVIKTNYLTLPLMAKYFVSEGFSVEVGPQIGFLLSNKTEFETTDFSGGSSQTEVTTKDNKDTTASTDIGINFGVSYKLKNNLFFSARYYAGLTNIYKSPESSDNTSYKNGVFQLSVGYMFN